MYVSDGESIPPVCVDIDVLLLGSRKTWVSAISSALWAVVPSGKLLAQMVCFPLITAAPAFRLPLT